MKAIIPILVISTIFIVGSNSLGSGKLERLRCAQLLSGLEFSHNLPAGKSPRALMAIENIASNHAEPGFVILFRGQASFTSSILSASARIGGIEESEKVLQKQVAKYEREIYEEKVWLAEKRRENSGNAWLAKIYDRKETELRSATPIQMAAMYNSQSIGGESAFVSTSQNVSVAAGNYQGGEYNRYIYILKVPSDIPISVWEARLRRTDNSNDRITNEMEYAIPHDATSYVVAIIDTQSGEVHLPTR